jgi:hypothetical protein
MKYIPILLAASALQGTFITGASAHSCHRHRVVVVEQPAYPRHHHQWNPVGAVMAVPRAALQVPVEALSIPERVLGVDDDE